MTGIYDRTTKKGALIFPFVLALVVHGFILNVPLPEPNVPAKLSKAISVAVVHWSASRDPESSPEEGFKSQPEKVLFPEHLKPKEPTVRQQEFGLQTLVRPVEKKQRSVGKKFLYFKGQETPEGYEPPEPSNQKDAVHDTSPFLGPETLDSGTGAIGSHPSFPLAKRFPKDVADRAALSNEGGEHGITYAVPKYKENPPPRYPAKAKRRGHEGRTVLNVEVLADGTVGTIKIAKTSGFNILDKAALASVKTWIFVPGTENGKPVQQTVLVPVRFHLK